MEIEVVVHVLDEDKMPDEQRRASERVKQLLAASLKTVEVVDEKIK